MAVSQIIRNSSEVVYDSADNNEQCIQPKSCQETYTDHETFPSELGNVNLEINKMNIVIHSNEEAIMKMNHQFPLNSFHSIPKLTIIC